MSIGLLAGYSAMQAVKWIDNNYLGVGDWLSQLCKPEFVINPPRASNNMFSDYVNGYYNFSVRCISPTIEDLRALDNFFESYGYSLYKFEKPNLKVRKTFTFIKTANAIVKGNNINAINQLQDMLNNGYTFWAGEIGVTENSSNEVI